MLFVLFSYLPCELALIVLLVGLLYRNKSKTLRYFNFSMVFLVFTLGFYSFLVNATGDEEIAETAELFYRVAVSSTLSMFLVFFRVLVGKPLTIALSFLMVLHNGSEFCWLWLFLQIVVVVVRWLIKHIPGNNAMSCASINRQTFENRVGESSPTLFI